MTRWKTRTLGEVCSVIARGMAPSYVENGGTLVLNQKCIRNHAINYALARRHNAKTKRVPSERLVQLGDVLINSTGTGTLGRVAQVRLEPPEPSTVDTHVTIVRPQSGEFYADFFGYALVLLEDQLSASGEGTSGQTELARTTVSKFEITYPSDLEEQRRIVAVLDEAFAAIATASANAEKILANAREILLDAIDRELESSGPDWTETTMEAICSRFEYGTSAKSLPTGSVPVLRMGNLQNGEIDWSDLVFTDDPQDIAQLSLRPMDVLFNRTNSLEHVGKSAIVRSLTPAVFAGYLIRLHYRREAVDSEFLNLYLNSRRIRAHGRALAGKSVNQANISAGKLKTYPINLPPLSEQSRIVSLIAELRKNLERLQAVQTSKIDELSSLKQSILRRSFSGQLTATMPKTIAA